MKNIERSGFIAGGTPAARDAAGKLRFAPVEG
jgi:hypothetical protein